MTAIDAEAAMNMALSDVDSGVDDINGDLMVSAQASAAPTISAIPPVSQQRVTREEAALVNALREGGSTEEEVFVRVRDQLGSQRLTQKLRLTLQSAAAELTRRKLITAEDEEYFLLPAGRSAQLFVSGTSATKRSSAVGTRRPTYRGRFR